MTPPVDVIVDRQDDVATTRAIQRLAAEQPTVLAISIAPDTRAGSGVIWAILRALGKRLDRLDRPSPDWADAERWLVAHRIAELIALRAQHLTGAPAEHLARLGERADIAIALVYGGRGYSPAATITLDALLERPRRQHRADPPPTPWPTIPRSHPLRLRHDCAQQLAREHFCRVDGLLFATLNALDRWLLAHQRPTRRQLCAAVRVLRVAHDPNQRHVRECAIIVALQTAGLAPPRTTGRACRPRTLSDADVDDALSYTFALHAGYTLAQRLTGLSPDLLDLVLGDQISDDSLLGCGISTRGERSCAHCRATACRSSRLPHHGGPHPQAADEPVHRCGQERSTAIPASQSCFKAADASSPPPRSRPVTAPATRNCATTASSTSIVAFTAPATSRSAAAISCQSPPIRALTGDWKAQHSAAKQPGRITATAPDFQ